MSLTLQIGPDVRRALAEGHPVVALESALVTHGLPEPYGLEAARLACQAVMAEGAVPAVVGVVHGGPIVGLDQAAIESLASWPDTRKLSLRDLAAAVSLGWSGGATLAATLWLASRCGVSVVATGGMGGARGADVSADLVALATVAGVVVCSGIKPMHDLTESLEWLETHGVPVLGYRTDRLPGFLSIDTDQPVPARVDDPREAARVYEHQRDLGLGGLMLVVPVPAVAAVAANALMEATAAAEQTACAGSVAGPQRTPFMLAQVQSLLGRPAVEANLALLENNARVAAQVAAALAGLSKPHA